MGVRRLVLGSGLVFLVSWFPTLAFADEAAELFVDQCSPCHGQDARGRTPIGRARHIPNLLDATVRARLDHEYIEKLVHSGRKDPQTGKERMPAFANRLTDEQINLLAGYVMGLGE